MDLPRTELTGARVIKRYANRKLYDTRDSRYVTLQQIGEYVRAGEEVQIIDNTSKEDLTSATLAQIVYEAEKQRPDTKATMGALRGLIQNSSERLMTTLREGPVGKLMARRDDAKPEDEKQVERPTDSESRKPLLIRPKDAIDGLSRMADEQVQVVLGTAIHSVHQLQTEVRRLQGRIEELETRLVAMQQRRTTGDEPEPKRLDVPPKP